MITTSARSPARRHSVRAAWYPANPAPTMTILGRPTSRRYPRTAGRKPGSRQVAPERDQRRARGRPDPRAGRGPGAAQPGDLIVAARQEGRIRVPLDESRRGGDRRRPLYARVQVGGADEQAGLAVADDTTWRPSGESAA